jgi:hypothetical protein
MGETGGSACEAVAGCRQAHRSANSERPSRASLASKAGPAAARLQGPLAQPMMRACCAAMRAAGSVKQRGPCRLDSALEPRSASESRSSTQTRRRRARQTWPKYTRVHAPGIIIKTALAPSRGMALEPDAPRKPDFRQISNQSWRRERRLPRPWFQCGTAPLPSQGLSSAPSPGSPPTPHPSTHTRCALPMQS